MKPGAVSAWWGVGGLALVTAAGAAIGASVNTPCPPSGTAPEFCGPSAGALIGGADGLVFGGVLGLGAALSPKYRAAGLAAAGLTVGLIVFGQIKGRLTAAAAAPQVTP